MIDEERLIDLLNKTAKLLEFNNENKFKIMAYSKGAEIIESFDGKFSEMYNSGTYKTVKGIGKGLQEFIKEFAETNSTAIYDELFQKAPIDIFEMLKIKGLGLKKIRSLYDNLQIERMVDLERICKSGEILSVKGITDKFANDILSEINRINRDRNKILLGRADLLATQLCEEIESLSDEIKIERVGELRRFSEVISCLEFVLLLPNNDNVLQNIRTKYNITYEETLENYYQIDFNYLNKISSSFYLCNNLDDYKWVKFIKTGNSLFIEQYFKNLKKIQFDKEEELFVINNVKYVFPEVREPEAIDYINRLDLSSDLEENKIKGLIHFHTTFSDGLAKPEEMVIEAINQNFEYFVISDHSKAAYYANGLGNDRIIQQNEYIVNLRNNDKYNLFHGIESDILPDGNLDYDEEILKYLDFIIASVHSRFDMSKEEMTQRIIKAIENPYTDVIGHLTGRVLLRRKPYELDVFKILDACAANDVAIEINASPYRLDLDWRNIYYAREKGVKFAINPDAHSTSEIGVVKYGLSIARKGGIKCYETINCKNLDEFLVYINRKTTRKFERSNNGLKRIN